VKFLGRNAGAFRQFDSEIEIWSPCSEDAAA